MSRHEPITIVPPGRQGPVTKRFAALSRDVAPAVMHDEVRVIYMPVLAEEGSTRHVTAVLSEAERQRAARLANPEDADRFVQRRAFRRFCGAVALGWPGTLSKISFKETPMGQPHLPEASGFSFSFSSCRSGMLGAWSTTHGVGVDIEDRDRRLDVIDLANQYFAEPEARAVRRAPEPVRTETFLLLWCAKEAALKSIGQGLPFGLSAFAAELEPELRLIRAPISHGGPARFTSYRLQATGAYSSLVTHRHE